ncbi:hypothetical protein ABIB26_004409 [Arthrobacter sp. UYEF20]
MRQGTGLPLFPSGKPPLYVTSLFGWQGIAPGTQRHINPGATRILASKLTVRVP